MTRGLILLAALAPSLALAQTIERPTQVSSQDAALAFAVKPPDEGSPFFTERHIAQSFASQEARAQNQADQVAVFPKSKDSPDSATSIFTRFFTDMFSSVNLSSKQAGPSTQKLTIEPIEFSLQDRRDLDAKYSVRNNTGKMVRLAFPTSQRIEMITRDASGKEIEKWSDDRAFKPQDGIVIINPKERIEYIETIPTRDMKAGETYTIQAEVLGYPDFNVTQPITPSP